MSQQTVSLRAIDVPTASVNFRKTLQQHWGSKEPRSPQLTFSPKLPQHFRVIGQMFNDVPKGSYRLHLQENANDSACGDGKIATSETAVISYIETFQTT